MKTLLVILLCIAIFLSLNLGFDYINFGYGLHPVIAFPIIGGSLIWLFLIIGHRFD